MPNALSFPKVWRKHISYISPNTLDFSLSSVSFRHFVEYTKLACWSLAKCIRTDRVYDQRSNPLLFAGKSNRTFVPSTERVLQPARDRWKRSLRSNHPKAVWRTRDWDGDADGDANTNYNITSMTEMYQY